MSRAFPAALATAFRSESPKPVWLVHIASDGSPANLYYAAYDGDVVLGGLTFAQRPMEIPESAIEGHSEAPVLELKVADADGVLSGYLAAGATFRNQRVKFYLTDLSVTGSGSSLTDSFPHTFFVEAVSRIHGWIVFRLRSQFNAFDIDFPTTTTTHSEFPGLADGGAA